MKKRDLILVLAICFLAFGLFLAGRIYYNQEGGYLQITVDNETYGIYPLDQDQEITIYETNRCRIENGAVSMIWADCPDQLCVHSLSIRDGGGSIICMPNRVVLQIISQETQSPIDGIAG